MDNSKADACSYVLVCLLQRLEGKQVGLIDELKEGVKSDMNSAANDANTDKIFSEALNILMKAKS